MIHKGENESVEFKESIRLKEQIGQVISAFCNANGGSILIGISDAGTIIGVDIGKNTLEELVEGWNKISDEHKNHPLKPKLPKIISDKYSILVIFIFYKREI